MNEEPDTTTCEKAREFIDAFASVSAIVEQVGAEFEDIDQDEYRDGEAGQIEQKN